MRKCSSSNVRRIPSTEVVEESCTSLLSTAGAILPVAKCPQVNLNNGALNIPANILPGMKNPYDLQLFPLDAVENDVTGHWQAAYLT